jgi:hypothetical protein
VEERARITEIQDSLIDRYVEQKAVIKEGNRCRAMELELEIEELLREKEKIKHWAARWSAWADDRPPFERSAKLPKARVGRRGCVIRPVLARSSPLLLSLSSLVPVSPQTAGAVQYPPLSIGEDAQPPLPAKMMSQPVSPRQIEFGVSGSSLPPAKPPYGIDLDTDRLLMQPVPLNGASPVPPTRGGSS